MRTLWLAGLLTIPLMVPAAAHARWDGARDNKSPAALGAMTNEELFHEAFDVCVRRAMLESFSSATDETRQAIADCNDYLEALAPAVRQHNAGTLPLWMTALESAHTTKACQAAFQVFLKKGPRPAPAPKPAPVDQGEDVPADAVAPPPPPTSLPKATPAPAGWSEQLPPWLAPR